MSTNPYQSPDIVGGSAAADRLKGPAIALIVVALIGIAMMTLSLAFSVFLLTSGVVDQMAQPAGMSKRSQVTVRAILAVVILLSNAGTLFGGLQMLWRQNRSFAQAGCILACIPCFSPCLILGIPFGVWGLTVLNDEQVQREFKS